MAFHAITAVRNRHVCPRGNWNFNVLLRPRRSGCPNGIAVHVVVVDVDKKELRRHNAVHQRKFPNTVLCHQRLG